MTLIRNISTKKRENTAPGHLKKVNPDHVLDYLTTQVWAVPEGTPEELEAEWETQQSELLAQAVALEAEKAAKLAKKAAQEKAAADAILAQQAESQRLFEEQEAARKALEEQRLLAIAQRGNAKPKSVEVKADIPQPIKDSPKPIKSREIK